MSTAKCLDINYANFQKGLNKYVFCVIYLTCYACDAKSMNTVFNFAHGNVRKNEIEKKIGFLDRSINTYQGIT